jgi:hypothetical protein
MVTKEKFLEGCWFVHKDGNSGLISKPYIDHRGNPDICLEEHNGRHFANISKVDKTGFVFYTFRLGKRFGGRVLFKDLILIKEEEVSNES